MLARILQGLYTTIRMKLSIYMYVPFINDKYIHNSIIQPPGWSFGNAERTGSDKPKYDFYENAAFLDDPL